MAVRHPEIADHAQLRDWVRDGRARLDCSFAAAHWFMSTPTVERKRRIAYYRRLLAWHASWLLGPGLGLALGMAAGQTVAMASALAVLGGGWWLRGQARAMAIDAATAAALADEAAYVLLDVDGGMRVEVLTASGAEPATPATERDTASEATTR